MSYIFPRNIWVSLQDLPDESYRHNDTEKTFFLNPLTFNPEQVMSSLFAVRVACCVL